MPKHIVLHRPHLERDLIVVIILNIVGFLYAILADGYYLGTVVYSSMVIGIPAMVYMSTQRKKNWKKIAVFSVMIGFLYCFLLEFIAQYNHIWDVPNPSFPIRVFGFLPVLDTTIGHTLLAAYTATFYEHFVDAKHISKRISERQVFIGAFPAVCAIAFVLALFHINPEWIRSTSYLYIYIGTAAIIPPIIYALKKPSVFQKMALTGVYFFFFFLVLEIVGVNFSYWTFEKGTYVGYVNVFNIIFPFEEVFFWMAFYSSFLIFFYEKFIDNE